MLIEKIYSFLPRNTIAGKKLQKYISGDINRILSFTGFNKIKILKKNQNARDFFYKCIKFFLKKSKINIHEIDAIIFSSHSRSFEMPIFSAKIQDKFNFRNNILCYDLPGSCAGFTNGLIHSYSFLKSKIAKKILLICADAHSKNLKDKNLKPVISDGLSCILIKNSNQEIIFDLGVDGKESHILNNDNFHKSLQMNGTKVLEFALNRVPQTIQNIKKKLAKKKKLINYYSFHQPNKTIFNYLVKKIGVSQNNLIKCVNFGNTSASSIPVSLSAFLPEKKINNKSFLFCGFGAGLSWSSVYLNLNNTFISKIYYL